MIIASETNQDDKDKIVRILAATFISQGFGYSLGCKAIKAAFSKTIAPSTFNNYMTAITKAAYLELEDFIYKQCGKQVKPLNHKQIQMIRTPMIKCREWMNQDLLSTFFKFVSTSVLQYSQHISKAEALELYHRLLSLIAYGSQKAKILLKQKLSRKVAQISKRIGLETATDKKNESQHNSLLLQSKQLKIESAQIQKGNPTSED